MQIFAKKVQGHRSLQALRQQSLSFGDHFLDFAPGRRPIVKVRLRIGSMADSAQRGTSHGDVDDCFGDVEALFGILGCGAAANASVRLLDRRLAIVTLGRSQHIASELTTSEILSALSGRRHSLLSQLLVLPSGQIAENSHRKCLLR
ncbi:hypothetical protein, partial [Mesorhizobium sp. L2C067A000]|uniref:hypothetical protein n=1 Tax=Mesorhizobium sp. L2C067A000 TaxID=1287106 RepID=UPI0012DE2250